MLCLYSTEKPTQPLQKQTNNKQINDSINAVQTGYGEGREKKVLLIPVSMNATYITVLKKLLEYDSSRFLVFMLFLWFHL